MAFGNIVCSVKKESSARGHWSIRKNAIAAVLRFGKLHGVRNTQFSTKESVVTVGVETRRYEEIYVRGNAMSLQF